MAHHSARRSTTPPSRWRRRDRSRKFLFKNPHSFLYFEATDEKGQKVEWQVELGAAASLTRTGWTPETLKPGTDHQGGRTAVARRRTRTACAARRSRGRTAARSSPAVVSPKSSSLPSRDGDARSPCDRHDGLAGGDRDCHLDPRIPFALGLPDHSHPAHGWPRHRRRCQRRRSICGFSAMRRGSARRHSRRSSRSWPGRSC